MQPITDCFGNRLGNSHNRNLMLQRLEQDRGVVPANDITIDDLIG